MAPELPFCPREHILENGSCLTVEVRPVPDTLTEFTFKVTRNSRPETEYTFLELVSISAVLQKLLIQYRVLNLHTRTPLPNAK
jgi:hypothetical protein